MIVFKGVYKSFGHFNVLRDINLHIPTGKITVILGRSGSGKSVMLKHILGFLKPDAGEIFIQGKNTADFKPKDWFNMRKEFGMLFQDSALFDSMNVLENVAFPLREHSQKPDAEILDIAQEKLIAVGLKDHGFKLPSELSGGMRKRVALARAIALEPSLVMFDEPTTGLDPIVTSLINSLIVETQRKLSCTFLIISHDINSCLQIADRIAMLYDGKIIEQGDREQIQHTQNPLLQQFMKGELEGPFDIFY